VTDRVAGFVVTLAQDMRVDDVEAVVAALGMIKGVAKVAPVDSDATLQVAYHRARFELTRRVYDALSDALRE
jgi:hypothetical protein